MPIGNEHESYGLTRRCQIAVLAKQYAWIQMDNARKERDQWKAVAKALQEFGNPRATKAVEYSETLYKIRDLEKQNG